MQTVLYVLLYLFQVTYFEDMAINEPFVCVYVFYFILQARDGHHRITPWSGGQTREASQVHIHTNFELSFHPPFPPVDVIKISFGFGLIKTRIFNSIFHILYIIWTKWIFIINSLINNTSSIYTSLSSLLASSSNCWREQPFSLVISDALLWKCSLCSNAYYFPPS